MMVVEERTAVKVSADDRFTTIFTFPGGSRSVLEVVYFLIFRTSCGTVALDGVSTTTFCRIRLRLRFFYEERKRKCRAGIQSGLTGREGKAWAQIFRQMNSHKGAMLGVESPVQKQSKIGFRNMYIAKQFSVETSASY
eukprot:TRINITY_DN36084_c0_g1_i1.p1 TRINITY_DN36084_c0_g1~~TRINITY_DN36084_c0_g1_i1.p1  ORF type:complete len:138 (-),score=11.63 TRINITY_DN36084_c0_g1_i1:92-505(-)